MTRGLPESKLARCGPAAPRSAGHSCVPGQEPYPRSLAGRGRATGATSGSLSRARRCRIQRHHTTVSEGIAIAAHTGHMRPSRPHAGRRVNAALRTSRRTTPGGGRRDGARFRGDHSASTTGPARPAHPAPPGAGRCARLLARAAGAAADPARRPGVAASRRARPGLRDRLRDAHAGLVRRSRAVGAAEPRRPAGGRGRSADGFSAHHGQGRSPHPPGGRRRLDAAGRGPRGRARRARARAAGVGSGGGGARDRRSPGGAAGAGAAAGAFGAPSRRFPPGPPGRRRARGVAADPGRARRRGRPGATGSGGPKPWRCNPRTSGTASARSATSTSCRPCATASGLCS